METRTFNALGGQCGRGMSGNALAEIARLLKSWEIAPPAWMIDPRRDFKDEALRGAPWAVLADPKAWLNGGGIARVKCKKFFRAPESVETYQSCKGVNVVP